MASMPKYKKFLKLFKPDIEVGINANEQVFNVSIVLRKDGADFKLGQTVQLKGKSKLLFIIKEILLHGNLTNITVVLHPVEVDDVDHLDHHHDSPARLMGELVVADLMDLVPGQEKMICEDVARDGMRKVISNIGGYPENIQRSARKHQLAVSLRNSVQMFLSGSSLSRSVSIGNVDWRLDPGILGLDRETDYSLEYRIEQFAGEDHVTSHLDMLLGRGWDVRGVAGGRGYRVIITLEIVIDMKQHLRLNTHAITCRGELDTCSGGYRHACVSLSQSLSHVTTGGAGDIMESIHSARGVSLDWEEFQESMKVSNEDLLPEESVSTVSEYYPDKKEAATEEIEKICEEDSSLNQEIEDTNE